MATAQLGKSHGTWRETRLWKALAQRSDDESKSVRHVVEGWMPDIEQIVAKGGTAHTDFTLHDEGHAFRVAERMVAIMPAKTLKGLGPHELAFLLLSAYLHDIGMTPEQKKVRLHHDYMLTGQNDGLTSAEVDMLQEWLDDYEDAITPPICAGAPSTDDLRKAGRLTTLYCRHRHNEWSAEWIRKHAPDHALGTLHDWAEELIRLCRSHHEGRDILLGKDFNPQLIGSPGNPLHRRYLACVLRVADILEFDPERTPEVILNHREIDPKSIIYWHRDHGVSAHIEDGQLTLSARPDNARLYRALEEMIDQIDQELSLCRDLADETHFEKCPWSKKDLPYAWQVMGTTHRIIEPKDDRFVYINSTFRPNTQKILQMLSGVELYGNPLVAVRELLQNAFDAVREQIAYERIEKKSPENDNWEDTLSQQHRVNLRLERKDDGFWLTCTDTGVGMNRRIIENHLLVSGQAQRRDIASLERRCKRFGFSAGRTGQFGIGVLSYFMLADRLCILTSRSPSAGDSDGSGWQFETEGVGAWGELQRIKPSAKGTHVRIHLKPSLLADPPAWYRAFCDYLERVLAYVPCHIGVSSDLPESRSLQFPPCWIPTASRHMTALLSDMRETDSSDTDSQFAPRRILAKANEARQRWEVASPHISWD